MNAEIHTLDVVALTEDIPEHDLRRGQVGTVFEKGVKSSLSLFIQMKRSLHRARCSSRFGVIAQFEVIARLHTYFPHGFPFALASDLCYCVNLAFHYDGNRARKPRLYLIV